MGNSTSTPKALQRSAKTKSVIFTFEDYTEDAPKEDTIKTEAAALSLAINKHCRDFYHDQRIQAPPSEIEKTLLKERDRFPTLSVTEMSHLLCDIRTRSSSIPCFISHMVIKNIGFYGLKRQTLLSPSAVGCISEFGFGDPDVKLSEEEEIAFTQWRAVTSHLMPKMQKRPTSQQNERIDKLVAVLDETLVHFCDRERSNTAERLASLRNVVLQAAIVGELIFASPARWKFDWHASRRDIRSHDRRSRDEKSKLDYQAYDKEGKALVVVRFPALVQIDTKAVDDKHAQVRCRRGDYDAGIEVASVLGEVRRGARIGEPNERPHSDRPQKESNYRPPEVS